LITAVSEVKSLFKKTVLMGIETKLRPLLTHDNKKKCASYVIALQISNCTESENFYPGHSLMFIVSKNVSNESCIPQ
jgi:hypothetical protein